MASLTPLSGALGHRRAAHLLRRSSFRFTKAKVDQLAGMTASQATANLFITAPLQMDQPVYGTPNTSWILPPGSVPVANFPDADFVLRRYVTSWWLNEALHDPGITSKMTLFLHQHMIVTAISYRNDHFFDYLALLRWASLGNFKKLATKMVTDNCMLRYLNNQQNTKNNPNENFAREFLELFTIGKGPQIAPDDYTNYTEDDIAQAARVFTGFRNRAQRDILDPETGIPRGVTVINQHDTGDKQFSDKFQGTTITGAQNANDMWLELDAFVYMVFSQDETARTFCRRLYRWFVSKNITAEIESDIIEPLATTFRLGDYEIEPVLKQLLRSQHFYDADDSDNSDEIVGGIIKSPLEITLQSMAFFNVPILSPTADPKLHYEGLYYQGVYLSALLPSGYPVFSSNDVAGYPGYYQEPDFSRLWFNSSTVIGRYKFPLQLLSGRKSYGGSVNRTMGFKLDIVPWTKNSGFFSDPLDPYALVQELLNYLLPEQIDNDRFNYFYIDVFLDNLPPTDWTYEWQNYLDTGDETEVKIPLEKLINAIMYSPEFQTY